MSVGCKYDFVRRRGIREHVGNVGRKIRIFLHKPEYSVDTRANVVYIVGGSRTANGGPKIAIPGRFDTSNIEQIRLCRIAPIFAVVTVRDGFVGGIGSAYGGPDGAVPLHVGTGA